MKFTLKLSGMSCGHCAQRVKEALESMPSVTTATVSLDEQSASVDASESVPSGDFESAVEESGYKVVAVSQD